MSNINHGCCNNIISEPVECSAAVEQKMFFAISKKGMATKAFIKNIKSGNKKNLQKQIMKGTVKILNP